MACVLAAAFVLCASSAHAQVIEKGGFPVKGGNNSGEPFSLSCPPRLVAEAGESVQFSCTATAVPEEGVRYKWEPVSGEGFHLLSDAQALTPLFTAPLSGGGEYRYRLTAMSVGVYETATVTVSAKLPERLSDAANCKNPHRSVSYIVEHRFQEPSYSGLIEASSNVCVQTLRVFSIPIKRYISLVRKARITHLILVSICCRFTQCVQLLTSTMGCTQLPRSGSKRGSPMILYFSVDFFIGSSILLVTKKVIHVWLCDSRIGIGKPSFEYKVYALAQIGQRYSFGDLLSHIRVLFR